MNLGMMRAQPRPVVAKLNGMSVEEADRVLQEMPVVEWQPDGTPLYGVPQCREKTVDIRTQVTLVEVKNLVTNLGMGVRHFQAEVGSRITVLVGKTDALAKDNAAVARAVTLLTNAYRKDPRKPYLTNRDLTEVTGWCASKMRILSAEPEFQTHMIRGTRNCKKHKKYAVSVIDAVEKRLRQELQEREQAEARSRRGAAGTP